VSTTRLNMKICFSEIKTVWNVQSLNLWLGIICASALLYTTKTHTHRKGEREREGGREREREREEREREKRERGEILDVLRPLLFSS